MTEPTTDSAVIYAIALLDHYGFDLSGYKPEELVQKWLQNYNANWVRLAVVEALYQGRYKAVSVEQILAVWARRKRTLYHFNHEFERLISRKLPQNLTQMSKTGEVETIDLPSLEDTNSHIVDPHIQPSYYSSTSPQLYPINEPVTATETKMSPLTDNAENNFHAITKPKEKTSIEENINNTKISVNSQTELIPQQDIDLANKNIITTEIENKTVKNHNCDISATDTDWSHLEAAKQPIHQFTPPPDESDFYYKLKAVAHQNEEASASSEALADVPHPDEDEDLKKDLWK